MEAFLAYFLPGAPPSEPHRHGVEEMVWVALWRKLCFGVLKADVFR